MGFNLGISQPNQEPQTNSFANLFQTNPSSLDPTRVLGNIGQELYSSQAQGIADVIIKGHLPAVLNGEESPQLEHAIKAATEHLNKKAFHGHTKLQTALDALKELRAEVRQLKAGESSAAELSKLIYKISVKFRDVGLSPKEHVKLGGILNYFNPKSFNDQKLPNWVLHRNAENDIKVISPLQQAVDNVTHKSEI
jgi:hypothetical protein